MRGTSQGDNVCSNACWKNKCDQLRLSINIGATSPPNFYILLNILKNIFLMANGRCYIDDVGNPSTMIEWKEI
jgi:hypothetical protein